MEHDIKWKYTNERIEYMMDYAISMFEYEGSTYVDANRLVQYIYTLDADVVPKLKDVLWNLDLSYIMRNKISSNV